MKHQRYLEVADAPDLATFERLVVDFGSDLGFGISSAIMVNDRPGTGADMRIVGNLPKRYVEEIEDLHIPQVNPVWKRLKTLNVPFIYDQDLFAAEGAMDIWDQQAPHGFRTGVAVALHLSAFQHFMLGFDREERLPQQDEKLTNLLATLQLFAVHAQNAATRLFPSRDPLAETPALTKRELEVLRWAMNGKTAEVTAQILGLSENTVNFHVRNILRKLGTSSKHQAVLKAMQLGLL